MKSRYIRNVSVLMFHIVCSAKCRRVKMGKQVEQVLKEVCAGIEQRWKEYFVNTVGQHVGEKVIVAYVALRK